MNNVLRAGALGCGLIMALALPALAADDDLVWQFNELRDQDTRRMNATLTYGIPETDAVKVRGVCEAKAGTAVLTSSVIFAADVGRLKNGTDVDLRFSGGGVTKVLKGSVQGVGNTEERIAGVRVELKHGDAFWNALQSNTGFDYSIPGYRSNTLNLSGARSKIKDFVQTCQEYADALGPDNKTASNGDSSGDKISEKEAFAIAKELGTLEAWDAFLNNFPSGFRSDLARAYVKRLGQDTGGGQTQQADQPSQPLRTSLNLTLSPFVRFISRKGLRGGGTPVNEWPMTADAVSTRRAFGPAVLSS